LIAKKDRVCFTCGDKIPGRSRSTTPVGKYLAMGLTLVILVSAGITAIFLQVQ